MILLDVNSFFQKSEKKLQRKLSNLLMFQCETWVCSVDFYNKKIKNSEHNFYDAIHYSLQNAYERKFFDINMFDNNFYKDFNYWRKKHLTGIHL